MIRGIELLVSSESLDAPGQYPGSSYEFQNLARADVEKVCLGTILMVGWELAWTPLTYAIVASNALFALSASLYPRR